MNKIRLLLTAITIVIVVIPLAGMFLAYQNNLLGLFIPPEISEMADDLLGGYGDNGPGLEPPTMVGEPKYDEASHTFTATFEYKNSFPMDITVRSFTGNVECADHRFPLGNASFSEPVSIDAGETGVITVQGTWTEEAINHFGTSHGNEQNVDVVLLDFSVDFSGIKLELDQSPSMQIPNPVYGG